MLGGWFRIETYLASTILPDSLDIAVGRCYVTISCGALEVWSRWTAGCWGGVLLLTLEFLVELADGHDDSLDVFAVVEVLLGLLVAFFQLYFDGDHLCQVSFDAQGRDVGWNEDWDKKGSRENSRPMHTCMLAFVNPGSLTIVGLQSTT